MKIFNTSRKMRRVFFKVKKLLKKLKITETIAHKAKLLGVNDFESAVEISLANVCRAQIHASITERLSPQFLLDRTTAKIDILKSDTLATACRADKTPLVDIRKVEFSAIEATAHSSVIDR